MKHTTHPPTSAYIHTTAAPIKILINTLKYFYVSTVCCLSFYLFNNNSGVVFHRFVMCFELLPKSDVLIAIYL